MLLKAEIGYSIFQTAPHLLKYLLGVFPSSLLLRALSLERMLVVSSFFKSSFTNCSDNAINSRSFAVVSISSTCGGFWVHSIWLRVLSSPEVPFWLFLFLVL